MIIIQVEVIQEHAPNIFVTGAWHDTLARTWQDITVYGWSIAYGNIAMTLTRKFGFCLPSVCAKCSIFPNYGLRSRKELENLKINKNTKNWFNSSITPHTHMPPNVIWFFRTPRIWKLWTKLSFFLDFFFNCQSLMAFF